MPGVINSEEFIQMYDRLADNLFRHCYFRLYNRERARELMQETFLKAWQYNIEHHDIRNLKALLYRIANNLVIDEVRKKKEVFLDDALPSQHDPFAEERQQRSLEPSVDEREFIQNHIDGAVAIHALDQLETNDRDVLIMRFVDGLSPREIAEVLHETPNVVSVRIHRAIKKLRTILSAT